MTTAPVLLFTSTKTPASLEESNGESRSLCAALFLLSRKLLMVQAMVKGKRWSGSPAHNERAAIRLLNLCVARIIEISKMPNTFPEITQEVLDEYESLFRAKSDHSTIHRCNGLTRREVEIVRHLAEGKCNKEIAAALGISVKTVETYRTRIMPKLGAHSLSDVTRFAVRNGIITILLDQPS